MACLTEGRGELRGELQGSGTFREQVPGKRSCNGGDPGHNRGRSIERCCVARTQGATTVEAERSLPADYPVSTRVRSHSPRPPGWRGARRTLQEGCLGNRHLRNGLWEGYVRAVVGLYLRGTGITSRTSGLRQQPTGLLGRRSGRRSLGCTARRTCPARAAGSAGHLRKV